MGCDIHVCTEYKGANHNKPDEWFNIDRWKLNPYYQDGSDCEKRVELVPVYRNRDYTLFSALAGVRDYGGLNEPFSKPRGMPDDASEATKAECERCGVDGHSHSYATLAELIAWQDANDTWKYSGLVTEEQVKAWQLFREVPKFWCQSSSQSLVPLVRLEWYAEERPLQPLIDALTNRVKEELWLGEHTTLSDDQMERARVVFWFDN